MDIGYPGRLTNVIYNCHLSPFHKSIALFKVRPSQYVPEILRCHLLDRRPSVSISAPPFIYSQGDWLFDLPVGAPGRGRVVEAHGHSLTLEIQLCIRSLFGVLCRLNEVYLLMFVEAYTR